MNRNDEYWNLITELHQEPPELAHLVSNAVRRGKCRRWKGPTTFFGSLASVCAAFVMMVNMSPAFAISCGDIPVLKELATLVAWSPSLKSAIEHDFIQYVGESQTANGITFTLEYVIADEQEIVVFYRTEGAEGRHSVSCRLSDQSGTELFGYSVHCTVASNNLNTFEIHFKETKPPSNLILEVTLHLYNDQGTVLTSVPMTFTVHLDPEKTAKAIVIPVEQWVELDGQRLLVERLELSPTKTMLYLDDDSKNTTWLQNLDFYFTDKNGIHYTQNDSALSAYGRPESEGFYTYCHQSLYFLEELEGLTLHITKASWLNKTTPSIQVDLTTGKTDWLPECIESLTVTEENIAGLGPQKTLHIFTDLRHSPLEYTYYDPEGGKHFFSGGSSVGKSFEYVLENYPFDTVYLTLSTHRITNLNAPLSVPIS